MLTGVVFFFVPSLEIGSGGRRVAQPRLEGLWGVTPFLAAGDANADRIICKHKWTIVYVRPRDLVLSKLFLKWVVCGDHLVGIEWQGVRTKPARDVSFHFRGGK